MNTFKRKHHAGKRGAERGGKAGSGTSGHQIVLLRILTTPPTQTMRQKLRSRRADLNGRPLTAQRQTEQRPQQTTNETNRQNALPTHLQTIDHHTIGLRNATATGHRFFANHPSDKQGAASGRSHPRHKQPWLVTDLRVHPTCTIRAIFDTKTVNNHQQAGNQTNSNAGRGHLPFQMVEAWNQPVDGRNRTHRIALPSPCPLRLHTDCPILVNQPVAPPISTPMCPNLQNQTHTHPNSPTHVRFTRIGQTRMSDHQLFVRISRIRQIGDKKGAGQAYTCRHQSYVHYQ